MRNGFRFSILANVILLLTVAWLIHSRGAKTTNTQTEGATGKNPTRAPSETKTRIVHETIPFKWNQVESADYRTYVSNLRGISCPEQTIRDIITADVHGLYAPRFAALKKQATKSVGTVTEAIKRESADAEVARLQTEELALIEALLDGVEKGQIAQEAPIVKPVVLQEIDLTAIKLDKTQIETLGRLRQRFLDEIGGPNQDPNDPAYRERWQKAQELNDDLVTALLGGEFFVNYQQAGLD